MNNEQFNKRRITPKFTNSQEIAVTEAIGFIAKPFDESKFIIGINGAGGTGKTFITNYIIYNCIYNPSAIQCCSPTHKACRVFSQAIGGLEVNTIQSVFGFRLNLNLEDFDPNHPQFNPMAKPKLEQIRLLIIDEVSMLPKGVVKYIYETCKAHQIKVIGLGDMHQLPPVKEKRSLFFDKCFKVFTLKEIVRQEEDNPCSKLLSILRKDVDNRTFRFLEFLSNNIGNYEYNSDGKGWCCVGPEQFKEYIHTSFNDEAYTENIDLYRIIAYKNKTVADWNNYVRNQIIKDADKKIITRNDLLMSYETIVDDFLSIILNNSEEYIVNEIVDYIDPTHKFKGFLIKFQLVNGGKITRPLFVIDHKDKYTLHAYYKYNKELIQAAKNATGATRASRWKEYYTFKKSYLIMANIIDSSGKILIDRDIDYGFAITANKAQGSTYNNIFVDVNDICYDKNGNLNSNIDELLRRLYTACSRVRNNIIFCYGK
ncbi:MAG: AAA domain protein [crAssphage sp. isolate ctbg_1]|uniref:AAA domain protein n=1 Tax=crAssphage sp. isolate ctbg_1 TaxID=2989854 RepID=A0A345MT51_9CAUD|nr:MAG: AAA domain protein [crAssphage sp. isolate ctbg_1]AXH74551.1 MAG: AAA domain protein [crAssphage sp. isolate ctbg_1]